MHSLPAGLCSPGPKGRTNSYSSSPIYGAFTSPEVETACPQPLRALPSLPAFSHELFDSTESQRCQSEWRPLSSASTSVGLTPNPEWQRSSSASTSMGPTPSPEDGFDPRNLQHNLHKQHRPTGATTASTPGLEEAPHDERMPPQLRKIFVGGVPQDLGQDELHMIFSEYGEVQRAWLQKCRNVIQPRSTSQPTHRGFGFIIFAECAAVDKLLTGVYSRYLKLTCGRRLEVKRAISSERMPQTPPSSVKAQVPTPQLQHKVPTPQLQAPVPPGALWTAGSTDDWRSKCPNVTQGVKPPITHNTRPPALQGTAPAYALGAAGSDGNWRSQHSGAANGVAASTTQQTLLSKVQAMAPSTDSWTAGQVGDWRSESPNVTQADGSGRWAQLTNAAPAHNAPVAFPQWTSDGAWHEGQHAALEAPMTSVTHAGGGGAAMSLGFAGTEAAAAHTAFAPCPEWVTQAVQWPQGTAQMDEHSKTELAALLRGATPEFYED